MPCAPSYMSCAPSLLLHIIVNVLCPLATCWVEMLLIFPLLAGSNSSISQAAITSIAINASLIALVIATMVVACFVWKSCRRKLVKEQRVRCIQVFVHTLICVCPKILWAILFQEKWHSHLGSTEIVYMASRQILHEASKSLSLASTTQVLSNMDFYLGVALAKPIQLF